MNRKSFPFQINENTDIKESLIKWFDKRIKPNSDPDLDQTMLEIYQLDPVHYGRMYWYQYLGAFMSYMTSSKDDYWVNPAYPQVLSYALVDPYFIRGYVYEPAADYARCMETNREFEKCLKYPYRIR